MQFIDVDICDHFYLFNVTKFSEKCEDFPFKSWRRHCSVRTTLLLPDACFCLERQDGTVLLSVLVSRNKLYREPGSRVLWLSRIDQEEVFVFRFFWKEHEGYILFGLPGSRQQKFLVLRFLTSRSSRVSTAEVFQVSNDDTVVAQRWLKDTQPEEKTNTDCFVKEQEKEYQTRWKIKTGNVLDFFSQRSTQQCTKSGVVKHLGVAVIQ
nr:zinc finger, CCHC-type [Tanacetum cinerariifolium]